MKKHQLAFIISCLLVFLSLLCVVSCSTQGINHKEPSTPEEVWGKLEAHEGERVWNTLTKEQQRLVNYPRLDKTCVYWTPKGRSYHSIAWCYILGQAKEVLSGTLTEAKKAGKTSPCSKCVGDR